MVDATITDVINVFFIVIKFKLKRTARESSPFCWYHVSFCPIFFFSLSHNISCFSDNFANRRMNKSESDSRERSWIGSPP